MLPLIQSVANYLADLDKNTAPLRLSGIDSEILQRAGDATALDPEYRRGVMAEFNAFRFQAARGDREPWNIYWTPLASGTTVKGEQWYTPDVGEMGAAELQHWAERAQEVSNPVLKARYADLVWEVGSYVWRNVTAASDQSDVPRPSHEMARQAVASYLQAIEERRCADELQSGECLSRAMELAISLKDHAQLVKAEDLLFCILVNGDVGLKGAWWLADEIACRFASRLNSSEAENEQILAQLNAVHRIAIDVNCPQTFDPHVAMDAADRISRRVGQTRGDNRGNESIARAAEAFEAAAGRASALTAAAWLEPLIPRYRSIGKGALPPG